MVGSLGVAIALTVRFDGAWWSFPVAGLVYFGLVRMIRVTGLSRWEKAGQRAALSRHGGALTTLLARQVMDAKGARAVREHVYELRRFGWQNEAADFERRLEAIPAEAGEETIPTAGARASKWSLTRGEVARIGAITTTAIMLLGVIFISGIAQDMGEAPARVAKSFPLWGPLLIVGGVGANLFRLLRRRWEKARDVVRASVPLPLALLSIAAVAIWNWR